MAGEMTMLIAGMEAVGAALAGRAALSGLTAAQAALLSVLTNTVDQLSTACNDVTSGNGLLGGWNSQVNHITGIMDSFFSSFAAIEGLGGAAEAGLGGPASFFSSWT